jgi:nucleoside-diphosphate-sugar epimerase
LNTAKNKNWWLFGGVGFIGQHFARSVLAGSSGAVVYLLDIRDPRRVGWKAGLDEFAEDDRLRYIPCDVRNSIQLAAGPQAGDVILNLAAIHREPGHRPEEYFATNLQGAENVCQLAEDCGCEEIVFTSSISVYGEHYAEADEDAVPDPKTPYGQSKLQAEAIHTRWAERTGGKLSIIRPGVVFGPGEGGNVSRLVKESLRRKRAIMLQPDLAKAGIYIDELIAVIHWLRFQTETRGNPLLVNGVSEDLLHFNDFGKALQEMLHFERAPLTIPINALTVALKFASPLKYLVSASSKLHPERLIKLTRPNAIRSKRLWEWGYPFTWSLERALADWMDRGI